MLRDHCHTRLQNKLPLTSFELGVVFFCQQQGWFSNPEFPTSILASGWVSSKSLLLDRVLWTLKLALSSKVAENDLELLSSLPLLSKSWDYRRVLLWCWKLEANTETLQSKNLLMAGPYFQSPIVGEWKRPRIKAVYQVIKSGILQLFLWSWERYMLWIYGQTVNTLWSIVWSVLSQNEGNNLQCVIHKAIEEEPVKKRWPLTKNTIKV